MKHWRGLLTAAVFVLFGLALFMRKTELSNALDQIARLSPSSAFTLLALVGLRIVSGGMYTSAVTPGLSVVRAAMVQQASAAANNTVIGSGPLSTGVRIAMMRSWKIADARIALTIVVLNIIAAYIVWTIGLITAMSGMLRRADGVIHPNVYALGIVLTTLVLVGSTVLWWALLQRPRFATWLAGVLQRLWDVVRRRFPRLPGSHLVSVVERSRIELRELIRCRGWRIFLCVLVDQLLMAAILLTAVRSFGIAETTVSTAHVLTSYGAVRLLAAVTPIPGGVGVTEFGLATLLASYGGDETMVLAAVLTYRVLTFGLPIINGGLCFAAWRWEHRVSIRTRRKLVDERVSIELDGLAAVGS